MTSTSVATAWTPPACASNQSTCGQGSTRSRRQTGDALLGNRVLRSRHSLERLCYSSLTAGTLRLLAEVAYVKSAYQRIAHGVIGCRGAPWPELPTRDAVRRGSLPR